MFQEDYPALRDRGVVTWNGLDTEAFACRLDQKEKLLFYAGRLIPMKGALEFVEAGARFVKEHKDWKVVVCGGLDHGDSEYGEKVVSILKGMGENGEYLGYQKFGKIMSHFAKAEIAVVPSNWPETFGRTAMEAMTAGAALISSGRGGLREVSGELAVYLSEVSEDAIVEAMTTLVEDEEMRRRLQREGRERMCEVFDIRKTVAKVDAVREALLKA